MSDARYVNPQFDSGRLTRWPVLTEEHHEACNRVLESGNLYGRGAETDALEREFAAYTGARFAVACDSCTHAIHAALLALDIGPGDEVIVPAYTFIGTVHPILWVGAVPVFVDVHDGDGNIDRALALDAITSRTKAILPVHIHGVPCEIDMLAGAVAGSGIHIIEDACQAHGATVLDRHVGRYGKIGCFSLNAVKNMPGGQGGLLITDDERVADRLRQLIGYGDVRDQVCHSLGYSYGITEMSAALSRASLEWLDDWLPRGEQNAQLLTDNLALGACIKPLGPRPRHTASWHKYRIAFNNPLQMRDAYKRLQQHGIPVEQWQTRPLPEHPAYAGKSRVHKGYDRAKWLLDCSFLLFTETHPLIAQSPEITKDVARVASWALSHEED